MANSRTPIGQKPRDPKEDDEIEASKGEKSKPEMPYYQAYPSHDRIVPSARSSGLRLGIFILMVTIAVATGVLTTSYLKKPYPPRDVRVQIVDAITETPISGAKVSIESSGSPPVVAFTDSNGTSSFKITYDTRPAQIRVEAQGYQQANMLINDDSAPLKIVLRPGK